MTHPAPEAEILHLTPISSPITPTAMLSDALQRGGVSMEALERLMGMSERYEANNARRAFYKAMAAAKAEIAPIIKSKTVGYEAKQGGGKTSYRHETLKDVMSVVDPAL